MQRLQAQQVEQQKREILRKFLTIEAYERVANVRISSPDLYNRLVEIVAGMAQGSRINTKITEAQIIDLLARLTAKVDPKIEFKHK